MTIYAADPTGLKETLTQDQIQKMAAYWEELRKPKTRRLAVLRHVLTAITDIISTETEYNRLPGKYSTFVPHPTRGAAFPKPAKADAPWPEVVTSIEYTVRNYTYIGIGGVQIKYSGTTQNFPIIPGMQFLDSEFFDNKTIEIPLINFVHEANHDWIRYGFEPYDHATNYFSPSQMGQLLRSLTLVTGWLYTQYDPITNQTLMQKLVADAEAVANTHN